MCIVTLYVLSSKSIVRDTAAIDEQTRIVSRIHWHDVQFLIGAALLSHDPWTVDNAYEGVLDQFVNAGASIPLVALI